MSSLKKEDIVSEVNLSERSEENVQRPAEDGIINKAVKQVEDRDIERKYLSNEKQRN